MGRTTLVQSRASEARESLVYIIEAGRAESTVEAEALADMFLSEWPVKVPATPKKLWGGWQEFFAWLTFALFTAMCFVGALTQTTKWAWILPFFVAAFFKTCSLVESTPKA
jgi:hypothetical protein